LFLFQIGLIEMELKTLRAFVEVVRQGGFSAASRKLYATQSAFSKAVRQLEDELGVRLLDRVGRRVLRTEAGEIVYRRAQAMLRECDGLLQVLKASQGLQRGVLRLSSPPVGTSEVFADCFARYRRLYPGVEIHLLEHGSRRLEEILRDEPLILFAEGFALNPVILQGLARRGVESRVVSRSSQIEFIVALVAAGMGVAFLPRMIALRHRQDAVRVRPLEEAAMRWHLDLIWRRDAALSPAARAWRALCRLQCTS